MTQSTFRWLFVAVALLALAAAVLTSIPAGAEWPQGAFSCKTYRADLYWKSWARRHCSEYRWRRWRHYRRPAPDAEVMAAQIRLNQLGYELEADGFTGPATKNAIEVFQDERDLEVTGALDRETKRALDESDGVDDDQKIWSRRPEICRDDNGRECTCEPIIVFSGEHVSKDAETETLNRWRGHVRALIGETFMNWEHAPNPKILQCWHTGTGERTTDRFGQTRCVAQARACFGPPAPAPYSGSRKDD
jgi:hypothetical protein